MEPVQPLGSGRKNSNFGSKRTANTGHGTQVPDAGNANSDTQANFTSSQSQVDQKSLRSYHVPRLAKGFVRRNENEMPLITVA